MACIGAFDGLHLGHRAPVGRALARARARGVPAVALSFEPLPREFFAGDTPPPPVLSARGSAGRGDGRGGGITGRSSPTMVRSASSSSAFPSSARLSAIAKSLAD